MVPRIDDFGGEGVALLREYFDMMPAGVLPALKADFLISLFCFRIGNPQSLGAKRLVWKRQSLGIGSPEMARRLGETAAELPFGVRDLEALLVSDLVEDRHEEDPKGRPPWAVFTAWAALEQGFRAGAAATPSRSAARCAASSARCTSAGWRSERRSASG